ncbi:hypothetical protein N7G274_003164 [Stereocaulon virgatum]|uniref:Uncharacterized protein n=1 Tax=Stereocaulon virgatum TaxID=373712 RepID=A0ABR4AF53_9LECA
MQPHDPKLVSKSTDPGPECLEKGLKNLLSKEAATAKAREDERRAYHRTTLIVTIASRMYGFEQSASDSLIRSRVSEFLDSTFEKGGVIPSRIQWEGEK